MLCKNWIEQRAAYIQDHEQVYYKQLPDYKTNVYISSIDEKTTTQEYAKELANENNDFD